MATYKLRAGKEFNCIENGEYVIKKGGDTVELNEEQAKVFADIIEQEAPAASEPSEPPSPPPPPPPPPPTGKEGTKQ